MLFPTLLTIAAAVSYVAAAPATTFSVVPSLSATGALSCKNNKTLKFNCPVKGSLKKPQSSGKEIGIANLNACRDICLTHSKCISFFWNLSGGTCIQYGKDLPHQRLVRDKSKPGVMYNRACFRCTTAGSTSPAPTSTTTSDVSTTSDSATTSTSDAPDPVTTSTIDTPDPTTTGAAGGPDPTITSTVDGPDPTSPTASDPNTTTIVSSTAAADPIPAPRQCNNGRLQYAVYHNDGGDNIDNTYSTITLDDYKTGQPTCSGTTTYIGQFSTGYASQDLSVYGSSCTFQSQYFIMDHRGYIFAPLTGDYTVTVNNADDGVFIWYGQDAYSGWERENAELITNYRQNYGRGTVTVLAQAGSYTPLRIFYINGQKNAGLEMSITDPNGDELLTTEAPVTILFSMAVAMLPRRLRRTQHGVLNNFE